MMNRICLTLAAAVILVSGAGQTGAAEFPFEGTWVPRGKACEAELNERHEAIAVITGQGLKFRAMTCNFESVLPGGASYRVEASCAAAGEQWHEFFTFTALEGRLYWIWAGKTGEFDPCRY